MRRGALALPWACLLVVAGVGGAAVAEVAGGAGGAVGTAGAGGAAAVVASHRDLDWQAPNLWVHVDNLDPAQVALFESSRHGWLAVLRRDDGLLGDGRALFWSADGHAYYSFYPFADWPAFEARREMVVRTQELVGKPAVEAYDAGDAALVSPHYSQFWRRSPDFDITTPATSGLTEVTAASGRLEVHDIDISRWDVYQQAWRVMAAALQAAEYPLACRTYRASYGRGEVMTWWLAPDAATHAAAPAVAAVLEKQLGAEAAAALLAQLAAVFPVRESHEMVLRPDMGNLGR